MDKISNFVDYKPMRSWDRQDFAKAQNERRKHQKDREDFCEFMKCLLFTGSLFVGLYALTIVTALL